MPIGTVYQFGIDVRWVASLTSTATIPKLPFYIYYTSFAFDPAPNFAKEIDVQQKTTAFPVTYVQNGGVITKTIPALTPPPPPPVPTITTVTYKFSCTFPAPSTGPMPTMVTITCGQAVKQ
jgi:hypothetical protein